MKKTIAILTHACGAFFLLSSMSRAEQFGPTGIFGNRAGTEITVTSVDPGSPADGLITPGMVITGTDGADFSSAIYQDLAAAIDVAESVAGAGQLTLRIKDAPPVTIALPVLGSYSATAPFNCPKSAAILANFSSYMAGQQPSGKQAGLVARTGLGASHSMADLAGYAFEEPSETSVWDWGYRCIAYAEYYLATNDSSVLLSLHKTVEKIVDGQDAGGLWGHKGINGSGRLPGYAQMNASSLPCFIGLLLAQKCGIDSPEIQQAIDKAYTFYRSYTHRGEIPYGVHMPKTNIFSDNGKSAQVAIAMSLYGDLEAAAYFSELATAGHVNLTYGHAANAFNMMWTPLGAAVAGPDALAEYFKETRWWYTIARTWQGGFYDNSTGANVSMPEFMAAPFLASKGELWIAGKNANPSIWLDAQTAQEVAGMSQIDYASLPYEDLISYLSHRHIHVRIPAAQTAAAYAGDPTHDQRMADMLASPDVYERRGAALYYAYNALSAATYNAMSATLIALLDDEQEDREVRQLAAQALDKIGAGYEQLLDFILEERTDDPLGTTEEALTDVVTSLSSNQGLSTHFDKHIQAALKLSKHKRQNVRGPGMKMLRGISAESFHLVADEVNLVASDADMSYHSYHNAATPVEPAIYILADLLIEDGLDHIVSLFLSEYGKGSFKRRATWRLLKYYEGNAADALEEYRIYTDYQTEWGWETDNYNAMVAAIENDPDPQPLTQFAVARLRPEDRGLLVSKTRSIISENGGVDTFTVALNQQPTSDVVVDLNLTNFGNVALSHSALTFDAVNWSTPQEVTLTAIDDDILGTDKSRIHIQVDEALSDPSFAGQPVWHLEVICTDDEAPGFTLSKTASTIGEDGGMDTFTVVLDAEPTSSVAIELVSSATGEVTVSPPVLGFTPANWNAPQTVTITGVNDLTLSNDSATITVSIDPAFTDDDFDAIVSQTVLVTVTDDETIGTEETNTAPTVAPLPNVNTTLAIAAPDPLTPPTSTTLASEIFGGLQTDYIKGTTLEVFDAAITTAGGTNVWQDTLQSSLRQDGYIRNNRAKTTHVDLGSFIDDTKGAWDARFDLTCTLSQATEGVSYPAICFLDASTPVYDSTINIVAGIGYNRHGNVIIGSGSGFADPEVVANLSGDRTLTVTLDLTPAYYDGATKFGRIYYSDSVAGLLGERDLASETSFRALAIVADVTYLIDRCANYFSNFSLSRPVLSFAATIALDGSSFVSDPQNNEMSYSWSVIDSPVGSVVDIVDASAIATTATLSLEGDYTMRLTATDNWGASHFQDFTVTVSQESPLVSVISSDAEASELGSNPGEWTISRTGDTSSPLEVRFSTSGTAIRNSDYTISPAGTVTIPAGQSSATVALTALVDSFVETNPETVTLTIEPDSAFLISDQSSSEILIRDNILPPPSFVLYDGNTANIGTPPVDALSPYAVGSSFSVLSQGTLEKTGHYFVNWNSLEDGSGVNYFVNQSYNITEDLTLFAQWGNGYDVVFESMGGSFPSPIVQAVSYGSAYGTLPATSRAGYTFTGWHTDPNGGTLVDASTIVNTGADHILYARWDAKPVVSAGADKAAVLAGPGGGAGITLNFDDATATDADSTITTTWTLVSGEPTAVSIADPSSVNTSAAFTQHGAYTFRLTASDASTVIIDEVTFYITAEGQSTVTYNDNDSDFGTAPVDANSPYNNSGSVTVLPNSGALVKVGYDFVGWNTMPDANGTSYSPGENFFVTGNTTLYAHWVANPNTYTVAYDRNTADSGTVPVDPTGVYSHLDQVGVLGNSGTLAKTGYTFVGWNTSADGSGSAYTVGQTFFIAENTTLHAQWSADTSTVAFDANGGTDASPLSITATYDAAYGTLATTSRPNYSFDGWFTQPTGGVEVTAATLVNIAGDHTLYAQWTADSHTVTFDSNGGQAASPGTAVVSFDSPYGTLATPGLFPGFTFIGWFTQAIGGELVTEATIVTATSDHTLYAQWSENITYVTEDSPLIPAGFGYTVGSTFQLVFVTSTRSNMSSLEATYGAPRTISTFNSYVNDVAAASTLPGVSGLTWYAIASTSTMNAKDNAPITAPVHRLVDGAKVADDLLDMWDGSIDSRIIFDESGVNYDGTGLWGVWSGTDSDGTVSQTGGLDMSQTRYAAGWNSYNPTDGVDTPNWIDLTQIDTADTRVYRFYALSEQITIVAGSGTSTLSYDANTADSGAVPVDANSSYSNGSTVTVLDNTGSLVKSGHRFEGWGTSTSGGTFYQPGDSFTITQNTTLYAQWGVVTTNHAVPHVWLDGINAEWSSDYEAAALADHDGDGIPTWQEYWTGTDPLDRNSTFKLDSITIDGGDVVLEWRHAWVGSGIPDILVEASPDMSPGSWATVGSYSPVNGLNSMRISAPESHQFYRLSAPGMP